MKRINLINDPLSEGKFLVKDKNLSQLDLCSISEFRPSGKYILIHNKRNKSVLRLHRFIKIDNKILRVLYLLYGDGSFNNGVLLSNINYRAHKEFINVFKKYFNIRPYSWKLDLILNKNFNNKRIRNSIKFWRKATGIKKDYRIYRTHFNTCLQGCVKTFYSSIKISKILNSLIDNINSKIVDNKLTKKQLCTILDGILNAEGGVDRDRGKPGLHKITITFNKYNKKEKELFTNTLKSLDMIDMCKIRHKKRFEISCWINHYKFMKIFVIEDIKPFSLHSKRALILLEGFINHQRTKSIYKYLLAISRKEKQTFKEINKELHYNTTSIEEALIRKFRKFGFFILEGRGIRHNPYLLSLSEEGIIFLKTMKKVHIWLKETRKNYEEDIGLLSTLKTK